MTTRALTFLFAAAALQGQTVCAPVPQYTPCNLTFDLPPMTGLDLRKPG